MNGPQRNLDLLVVGGGLAGSALARAMAVSGADVLMIEKSSAFCDRIRGEILLPWGAAEAQELGIYDLLLDTCAQEIERHRVTIDGEALPQRVFRSVSPKSTCKLSFCHPHMQEALLRAASDAGAEVWRDAHIVSMTPGDPPEAVISFDGAEHWLSPRLIAMAGGRRSRLDGLGGFHPEETAPGLRTSGMELEGNADIDAALHVFLRPGRGIGSVLVPNRPGHYRAYLLHHKDALPRRPAGAADRVYVLDLLAQTGIPDAWLAQLRPSGPLATFDGDFRWVPCPARDGIVLIGDAAGVSDPVWANGLSRTLRDVRILRDRLLESPDWNFGAARYARDHDDFFHRLRQAEQLNAEIFFAIGEEADRRRTLVFDAMQKHSELNPDTVVHGPEASLDPRLTELLAVPSARI